ncbi:MAG: DUF3383 domain-containing protein [Synergistaceae bacterium]|jgi:hypothetical protein|nr:DUF3383 domain-containing protein [Synergistaceae bacterium]
MGNLKRIVNISVDIKTPAVSSASFGNLLIVGPAPAVGPSTAPPAVGSYTDLEGVTDAGWVTVGATADPVGVAARIAFSQNPQPAKILIAVHGLEPISTTLNRALQTSGWYVICPAGIDESEFETIAEWTEAQTKLFAFTWLSKDVPVTTGIYYRTMGWYGKVTETQSAADVPVSNRYVHVAAVAKCLAYSAGSETWKFKQLASVVPSELTSTKSDALEAAHLNCYAEYGGRNITMNGQVTAGEWIDVIRFRDWLQDDMQYRIYNLLIMNTKVPYTNPGIALVENQMIASLKAGQAAGGIAPDEFDSNGNLNPGYTVTVPNSMDLSASQKASRALTGCKFSARLAGAIHAVTVNGELTY